MRRSTDRPPALDQPLCDREYLASTRLARLDGRRGPQGPAAPRANHTHGCRFPAFVDQPAHPGGDSR